MKLGPVAPLIDCRKITSEVKYGGLETVSLQFLLILPRSKQFPLQTQPFFEIVRK